MGAWRTRPNSGPLLPYWGFYPSIILILLEIVNNKLHPFLLLNLQDKNTQKVVTFFLQEKSGMSSSDTLNSKL
jgi:hypothetical protein